MATPKPNPIGALTGANDGLADGIITHAVNLERLKASEVQQISAMLRTLQGQLLEQLNSLDPTAVGGKTRANRLLRLFKNVQATIRANYSIIQKHHGETLTNVAELEGKMLQNAVGQGVAGAPKVGVALMNTLPPTTTLRALVNNTLIMGATQKEHWARQAGDLQQRFQDQMREGILAGEGVQDLTRRVRGSQANNFKDGIMNVKRYQAEALVRTSVQSVSNAARDEVIQANDDLFNGVQWLSTLDSRTSDICKARSGLRWDNDKKPVGHNKKWSPPPAHWNCRSIVTPITKNWSELTGKVAQAKTAEFTENFKTALAKQGFDAAAIAGIRRKMQSSMDGYVPAEFTYEDWIKSKPIDFQKQVLGEPRWRLWNSGKIGFVDLVDQRSNPLSLAELQELIDAGKTSIARATAAARQAAKAEAAAAAKEAAELAKKEVEAEKLLATYAAGGKGFTNYKISYDKLKKQGKLDGKTFQEQAVLVQAAKEQIDVAAKLSTIKKKFGDGKKLSPSELATYKALDADTKAEIRDAAAAKGLVKELEETVEAYKATISKSPLIVTDYNLPTPLSVANFQGTTAQKLLNAKVATKQLEDAVQAEMDAMQKLDKLIYENAGKQTLQGEAYEKITGNDVIAAMNPSSLIPGETMKAKLAAFNEVVDELVEKQIQQAAAAKVKLDTYANAQKGSGLLTQKKVYADLKKEKDFQALTATEQLAKVDAVAAATKAKADFDAFKSVVSTKLAQNKPLTKGELAKVNALTDDENDLLAAAIEKKQQKLGIGPTAAEPPAPKPDNSQTLVFADFKQVGGQGGSNLGGKYVHNRTGQEYYIKAPDNELAAKVEVLSAKLYKMAGVRTADIDLLPITGEINGVNAAGRLGIASRMEAVDDIGTSSMGGLSGTADGFAADAWLANWDVIGNGGPSQLNLKRLADGSAFRIDTGGTLFFRAQGGRKAFDANDVPELDSLRDPRMNSNGADVFGGISDEQIVAGVARIVAIKDDDIRRMVADIMGDDADDLADVLIGRKNFLAAKYEAQLAKVNKVETPRVESGITRVEERNIKDSGINGYSIATDKDHIEDQLVHIYETTDASGAVRSGVYLKVRGEAADKINGTVQKAGAAANSVDTDALDDNFMTALKGIAMRAKKGDAFEGKDFDRIAAADAALSKKRSELVALVNEKRLTVADLDKFDAHYKPWMDGFEEVVNNYAVGDKAVWQITGMFKPLGSIALKAKRADTGAIKWTKKSSARWDARRFEDGKAFDDAGAGDYTHRGTVYETTVDGVNVRYWDDRADAALRNRLELTTAGGGKVAVEKQLSIMQRLGIDISRASPLDREELYLVRTLYAQAAQNGRRGSWFQTRMKKADAFTDQDKKLKYLRDEVSKAAGVTDITALPSYRPLGDWQQNGHGRIVQYRPDLQGPEWEKFKNEYVLYHNLYSGTNLTAIKNIVEGGGHMAPTMDKLRRGIIPRGMSPERDIETGGAQYFFTRLRRATRAQNENGLVWRGSQAGRMDAISYDADRFGRTDTTDFVLSKRKATIEGMKDASGSGSNETIFKDSLSIFDDLLYIVVSDRSERQEIIDYLKTKLKRWPDGRKIEDVVVGRG
jgi:SPP1 gp7 family putative phage head morphogenesis protein